MMKPEWNAQVTFYDIWQIISEERKKYVRLFWKGVSSENNYDFQDAIRIFCRNYPEKEAEVLEVLYLGYLGAYEEIDEAFFHVLQWMADYEQVHGKSCFSAELQEKYEVDFSIEENVEVIFDLMLPYSPICDIVWILENRFGVDSKRIEYCLENMFMEIFSNKEFSMNDLVNGGSLNEIFSLRVGFAKFLEYMSEIPFDGEKNFIIKTLREDFAIGIDAKFLG